MTVLLAVLGVLLASLGLVGVGVVLAKLVDARPKEYPSLVDVQKEVEREAGSSSLFDYLNRRP